MSLFFNNMSTLSLQLLKLSQKDYFDIDIQISIYYIGNLYVIYIKKKDKSYLRLYRKLLNFALIHACKLYRVTF